MLIIMNPVSDDGVLFFTAKAQRHKEHQKGCHGGTENKEIVYAASTCVIDRLFVQRRGFERFYPGVKWLYRGLILLASDRVLTDYKEGTEKREQAFTYGSSRGPLCETPGVRRVLTDYTEGTEED